MMLEQWLRCPDLVNVHTDGAGRDPSRCERFAQWRGQRRRLRETGHAEHQQAEERDARDL